ncbi:hypothetical protein ACOMHN_061094 [Nucella lapillus]
MVTQGLNMLAGMFQTVFLREVGGGLVLTSWVTALYTSLMQLAGPVSGVVCSVFGCRASVMAGGVLLTLGLLVSSFCRDVIALLFAFGIGSGLGLGLVYSASVVKVNLSFLRMRPLANGSVMAAGGAGIMVMPALCRYLLSSCSRSQTLTVLAAIAAQLVVVGALLFPGRGDSVPGRGRGAARSSSVAGRTCLTSCSTPDKQTSTANSDTRYKASLQDSTLDKTSTIQDVKVTTASAPRLLSTGDPAEAKEVCNTTSQHSHISHHNCASERDAKESEFRDLGFKEYIQSGVGLRSGTNDKIENTETSVLLKAEENSPEQFLQRSASSGLYDKNYNEYAAKEAEKEQVVLLLPKRGSPEQRDYRESEGQVPAKAFWRKSDSPVPVEAFWRESDSPVPAKAFCRESDTSRVPAKAFCSNIRFVLTSPSILIICLQLLLSSAAVGIVMVHYINFCLQMGSHFDEVSLAFSANGLALTVSRFLIGALVQDRGLDPLSVYVGLALVTSLIILLTPVVAVTSSLQILVLVGLGLYCGSSYSLLTEITIHCAGVDTLSLTFGLEMVSAGVGYLLSPPIAGWLVTVTNSYSDAIFLSGVLYLISAFVAMSLSFTRAKWIPGSSQSIEKDVTPPDDDIMVS